MSKAPRQAGKKAAQALWHTYQYSAEKGTSRAMVALKPVHKRGRDLTTAAAGTLPPGTTFKPPPCLSPGASTPVSMPSPLRSAPHVFSATGCGRRDPAAAAPPNPPPILASFGAQPLVLACAWEAARP